MDRDPTVVLPGDAEADYRRQREKWRGGWRRFVFPGIWLVYLVQTANGIQRFTHGPVAIVGYAILIAFCALYLIAMPIVWQSRRTGFWIVFGGLVALCVAETPFAHQDAFVMCVFIGVIAIGGLEFVNAAPVIGAMMIVVGVVPALIPSWHTGLDLTDSFTLALVALAMYGFFSIIKSNVALAAARADLARLAAENERSRIARDLHDLLGHSLTTITVKAGLARRLTERGELERAGTEIAEVEELTRSALTDVRAAVSGYRDINLASELASAREVLRSAGIISDLPASSNIVEPAHQALFGWVVREGVTNVVRHSRAGHCTVTLGPTWIEIVDDGRGVDSGCDGNGLTGLRERVEAVGGTVTATARGGWQLRVDVPSATAPRRVTARA
jgi:two-component system sensor histidine kinase DesK